MFLIMIFYLFLVGFKKIGKFYRFVCINIINFQFHQGIPAWNCVRGIPEPDFFVYLTISRKLD
jgi:hypothetical protein